MKESFEIKCKLNVKPSEIYNAWLDSELHTKMTGGEAVCNHEINTVFTAWDEYISGKNIELIPNKKIVQTWRTVEFNESDEDSTVTILLVEIENGTEVTLTHTNIPDGQTQYKKGWEDHYFNPMKTFFEKQ